MKKTLMKNISLLGLALFLFSSCEKDEDMIIANQQGVAATLSASATTLALQKADEEKQAISFSWTEADYGFDAATTNTLQFAAAGSNFAEPKEVILPNGASTKSYTVLEFNALMLSMNLPTGVASNIEVRVKSEVTGTAALEPVYSNAVNLTVNPYPLISFMYVPGAYQGWNPSSADSLISPTSNGIYTGVIVFPAGSTEFKITPAKTWDVAYGDAGNGSVSTTAPGNLSVPSAGTYRLTLNLNDNTFSAAKYSWGLIGSATSGGWDADTDMTYNNGTQQWTLTTALVPGAMKFRLNDDWGTNYGGSDGDLVQGGADIMVAEAGTYKISMNLSTNRYSLEKL